MFVQSFSSMLEKWDAGSWQEPGPYEDPRLYEDPGSQEDAGSYDDSEFFDDPGKTQELDFHITCLIWWNLQLKADLFIIVECLHAVNRYIRNS